jgi:hypothetical protein
VDRLRAERYGWAVARLHKLKVASAMKKLAELRPTGESYFTIFTTLLYRAARKLLRRLPGRRDAIEDCR